MLDITERTIASRSNVPLLENRQTQHTKCYGVASIRDGERRNTEPNTIHGAVIRHLLSRLAWMRLQVETNATQIEGRSASFGEDAIAAWL